MRVQHTLNFRRINIETADDDHVLLALDDVEVTVFIHASDVTGIEPGASVAVLSQCIRGFYRVIPVTQHHLWASNTKFTLLAKWYFTLTCFEIDDLAVSIGYW